MDFDKKELSSYIDGVPFAIAPKFCPPRPVTLPFAINYQLPPHLLSEQYDFSVENKTIALYKSICEEPQKLKSDENSASRDPNVGSSEPSVSEQIVQPITQNASLWNPDVILQPQSQVSTKLPGETSLASSEVSQKFNLSEFENDTTSPFDFVELQTINDLEELNTVFQGLCTTGEAPPPENNSTNQNSDAEVCQENLGNVSKSVSFPLSQNFNPSSTTIVDNDTEQKTLDEDLSNWASSVSKSFSKTSDNYLSYSYPSVSSSAINEYYGDPTISSERVKRNSLMSKNVFPAFRELDCISSVSGYSPSKDLDTNWADHPPVVTPLRSSKSIPDLSSLSPEKLNISQVVRSHTPPASMAAATYSSFEESTFPKRPALPNFKDDYFSSNGIITRNSVQIEHNACSLLDPYDELSDSAKQIVDTIAEMGFHRGQVSRTVQHLGTDEKKVVEHLCQIQALEESGYDKLEAEAALHLHGYDKKEAIRYLDLLNQFQDFGFEIDVIKKALVQNKNDRDKAIETLLS